MVKALCLKHEARDAAGVLDGKLDEFIDTYLEAYLARATSRVAVGYILLKTLTIRRIYEK